MKSSATHIVFLSLLTAATLLTACQDEEYGYTKEDVQNGLYSRKFTDSFGSVDPNHTWSTASQLKLNVEIHFEGEYTVKVYTANPRYPENNAYLVGEFGGIAAGSHTLSCDMPTTVTCAYVGLIDADGNRMILPAEIAERTASVTFGTSATTRTVYSGSTPFTFGTTTNKVISTYDDIKVPLQTLPEHGNNTGKVTQNFEYISMGEFDIYPIYSITSNSGGRYKTAAADEKDQVYGERLGIYTYDSWGGINKDNDGEIQITWIWHMNRGILNAGGTAVESGCWYQAHKSGEAENNWHEMYWFENNCSGTDEQKAQRKPFCAWSGNNFTNGYDKIRTDGIHLSIPTGRRFGFVLDTDHGYVYSNSTYNLDEGAPDGITPDHIKDTYAATFHADNALYLAFEDWCYKSGGHDNDFNDLVLKLTPKDDHANPLIIDKDSEVDPIIYIVACEDLGGTFDWDFNDLVFGIEHVSGHDQARVKLLAAGGTLPLSLYYRPGGGTHSGSDNAIAFANLLAADGTQTHSLHAALGTTDETPVNVLSDGYHHAPVYSEYFPVDRYAFTVLNDADKFKINVSYADGSSQRDIQMPDRAGTQKVPQAFLIADPNWQWPDECQYIVDKYPDFQTWVANSLVGSNWTHTVWGNIREFNTIPSTSLSLLNFDGAVTYDGNKAYIQLAYNQMDANSSYKLALMLTDDATADFQLQTAEGQYSTIQAAPNGSILGDHLTTFSLSADVINAIRNSGKHGKLTLTFASGIDASKCIKLVNWYKDGVKLSSGIEAPATMDIYLDEPTAIPYTTENQESPVVIASANENIVRVNADGTLTGVAIGSGINVTITQNSSEHYGYQQKTVVVNVIRRQSTLQAPAAILLLTGSGCNVTTLDWTANATEKPLVTFSSDDASIATVDATGKVTAKKVGTTTLTVASDPIHYENGQLTVTVTVCAAPTVAFPTDHFHVWDGGTAGSTITGTEDGALTTASTTMVYGNSNVSYTRYLDLSQSDLLVATASGTGEPRFLFNRTVDQGTVSVELPRDRSLGYETVIDHGDGTRSYLLDLKKIREKDGFVHLHAIKSNGGATAVSSLKLDRFMCLSHYTVGTLTDHGYNLYKAEGYNTASPTVKEVFDPLSANRDANVIYGDNTPRAYTFKVMDTYKYLRLTYTGDEPRLFFNRTYHLKDNGTEDGEWLSIDPYKTLVTEGSATALYIDLEAIKSKYGYVHLNGIKKAWNNSTSVTAMQLLY